MVSVSQWKLSSWSVLEVGAGDSQEGAGTFPCLCSYVPPSETWPVLPVAWCRESCELAGAFSTRITPRDYCHEDLAPFTWVFSPVVSHFLLQDIFPPHHVPESCRNWILASATEADRERDLVSAVPTAQGAGKQGAFSWFKTAAWSKSGKKMEIRDWWRALWDMWLWQSSDGAFHCQEGQWAGRGGREEKGRLGAKWGAINLAEKFSP